MLLRALGLARLPAGNARPNLVGSVWSKLGWVREHTGNESGAEVAYRAAIAELTVPPDLDDLRPPPVIAELAFARDRLATLLIGDDNWSEARQLIEESVDDLRAARAHFSTESRPPREITGLLATTLLRSADLRDELDPGAAGAAPGSPGVAGSRRLWPPQDRRAAAEEVTGHAPGENTLKPRTTNSWTHRGPLPHRHCADLDWQVSPKQVILLPGVRMTVNARFEHAARHGLLRLENDVEVFPVAVRRVVTRFALDHRAVLNRLIFCQFVVVLLLDDGSPDRQPRPP